MKEYKILVEFETDGIYPLELRESICKGIKKYIKRYYKVPENITVSNVTK